MMTLLLRTAMAVIFTSVSVSAALAQTNSIRGRVLDPQRIGVEGASVVLSTGRDAGGRTTRTGPDGTFAFESIAPGTYVLRVEAAGFDPWAQSVSVTTTTRSVDALLQVAGVTESVVVAAPKLEEELPQEIEKSGARMQTITAAQIENGGYADVGQVLQALVPGLYLMPKAGAFDYVTASLQGSRTNEILWLVDGVRISNRLYNGTTPLDTLPSHMVERIEVIEGGQGLFYGTQAVAGVINVVTRSFSEDRDARVQTGFNTNRAGSVSAFLRDAVGGSRFVLFGSKDEAKGFNSFPDSQYQPSATDRHRGYDVVTFGGKYAYNFSDTLRFSAMYQLNDVRVDNLRPGRSGPTQSGGLDAAFNERLEHITSGKVDFTPRPDAEFFFKGYYHHWDSEWTERRNDIGSPGSVVSISDGEFWGFKDYGVNLMTKLTPTRGVEYFAGYDFQNYSGEDVVLLIAPNTERVHAVFGQVRTTPELLGRATLAAGVRYNAPTHSGNATVWNVSGRFDVTPSLFARAGVGTAFRYPDAYELFAVDPTCCFGNPDLKPERSTNVNGSVGGSFRAGAAAVMIEGIGFYRDVTDLIVDVDDGSGDTTITANLDDHVKVKGATLLGSVSGSGVSGSLAYTYTTSERGNELAGGYSAIAGIPNNQVEGSLDIHPARKPFGLTLTANYIGEMFNTVSTFGRVTGGDYAVVDLAGRVFLDRSRRHRINLRLENLFDEDYTTTFGRGFTDDTGSPFLVRNLGTPRTLHVYYSFSY